MLIDVADLDVIFLSYDEPNADENWADLKSKVPWATRVHGIDGSDAAHRAAGEASNTERFILVDGDKFKPFIKDNQVVPYTCIIGGDDMYVSIAAASILAKVYHDTYIEKLCDDNPILDRYDWRHNMCYGTRKHLDAINTYGITEYHRKTFGICKKYN